MAIEKRAHARVAAQMNARLLMNGDEVELPVRDISKGGIFLAAKDAFAPLGGRVQLKLALTAGIRPILVDAEVARLALSPAAREHNSYGVGLRFQFESPTQTDAVLDLMDRAMLGPGIDRRAWPRVYVLLNALCRSVIDRRVILSDLSEGGAGLALEVGLAIDEEISLELTRLGQPSLKLEGWVASSVEVPEAKLFRVGVRFKRLSPTLRQDLLEFLKQQYRK